jgi:hypothetical protein
VTKAIATPPNQSTNYVTLTTAEQTARDAEEAAWAAGADDRAAQEEREWRDAELGASDWMALPDSPTMSAAWTTYRQELRDMPTLTGFPNTHTRPTAP